MTLHRSKILTLVDSHAHLNMEEFDQDRQAVLQKAKEKGIEAILCPSDVCEEDRHQIALELISSQYPIYISAGIHPHNANRFSKEHVDMIAGLTNEKSIVAIGEIGLDFHYNFSSPETQKDAFQKQLGLAQDLGLPVIIHSRKAGKDVSDCMKKLAFKNGGVLHCFTEDWEFADDMIKRGFYVSFSGIITYPNAQDLRKTAQKIPSAHLMVETDSPFLTPAPFRGKVKRNEPAFVWEIARTLAELKNMELRHLAEATKENFNRCFQIEISKTR